ncbi:MAG: hypothetical protein QNJ77_08710 [Acidimicrobiia bacterium]|nr:hypothetical protein [Acidimicrobiia bacterium]
MRRRRETSGIEDAIRPDETIVVELDGVVRGYTRWSGIGGVAGIVTALTVPRVFDLVFVAGLAAIVAVLIIAFLAVYYGAGRPLAARNEPPLSGPYLSLILTDSRVLLFDRALTLESPALVESTDIDDVGTIRYGSAGPLVPQRLGFVIRGVEHREYEFARAEPVKRFVEAFGG